MREDDRAEKGKGKWCNEGQLEVKPSLSPISQVVIEIIQDIVQLLFTSFLIKIQTLFF